MIPDLGTKILHMACSMAKNKKERTRITANFSTETTEENVMKPYMQNRKRDTDVQNRLLNSVGEGEGGMF